MKSMTGFGSTDINLEGGLLHIEVKSVNSRNLDIMFNMSDMFNFMEIKMRKLISKMLVRGRVQVIIKWVSFPPSYIKLPNNKYVKNIWKEINKYDVPIDKERFMSSYLLKSMSYDIDDMGRMENKIISALEKVLKKVNETREEEGKYLKKDMELRIKKIGEYVKSVEKKGKLTSKEKIDRLKKELEKVNPDGYKDWSSGLVFLYDKLDITEEVTRLKVHIKRFKEIMKKEECGKLLSFMLQEMLRETNTIASKSIDADVTHNCVLMKEEIEKIREQVQNIL